jgi:hypothetical protein
MANNIDKLETKIEVEIEGDEVKLIIHTHKELLKEEEVEPEGTRTCCRIYDQDRQLLRCVGINEPTRTLADAKCAWKTFLIGGSGSSGRNNKGRCGDFPECDKV